MRTLMMLGLIFCAVGCGGQASPTIPQSSHVAKPAPKVQVMPDVQTMPDRQATDHTALKPAVVTDENGRARTITVPAPAGEPIKSGSKDKAPRPKEKSE